MESRIQTAFIELNQSLKEFTKALQKLKDNGKTIHTIRNTLPNRKLWQNPCRANRHTFR